MDAERGCQQPLATEVERSLPVEGWVVHARGKVWRVRRPGPVGRPAPRLRRARALGWKYSSAVVAFGSALLVGRFGHAAPHPALGKAQPCTRTAVEAMEHGLGCSYPATPSST